MGPYPRFFSITSQIFAATSGPPSRAMALITYWLTICPSDARVFSREARYR